MHEHNVRILTAEHGFFPWFSRFLPAEWWNGGMAEWRNGGMAEWRNGGMAEWRSGGMAEWQTEWRNGGMADEMFAVIGTDYSLPASLTRQRLAKMSCSFGSFFCEP